MKDKIKMRDTAAERIVEAVQFANLAGVNAADMGIPLSTALFRNIRDAMFHFRTMCDCLDEDEEQATRHYYSLLEHLSRGEKDAVIGFGQSVSDAVFDLMQMSDFNARFSNEEISSFRKSVHLIKNTFMDMRTAGMYLEDKPGITVQEAWRCITEQTERINSICHKRGVELF